MFTGKLNLALLAAMPIIEVNHRPMSCCSNIGFGSGGGGGGIRRGPGRNDGMGGVLVGVELDPVAALVVGAIGVGANQT